MMCGVMEHANIRVKLTKESDRVHNNFMIAFASAATLLFFIKSLHLRAASYDLPMWRRTQV